MKSSAKRPKSEVPAAVPAQASPALASSPITVRAICIGLAGALVLNLVMLYSDFYLSNTFLVGNHFPVASLGIVLLLVLFLNPLLRLFKARGLSAGELVLIWGMLGVAGGIGAAGCMRYLPSWIAAPAYLTNSSNNFAELLLPNLPDWMVVSKDPKNPAVKGFFEGLPAGSALPWKAWITPLLAWGLLLALLGAALFALTSLFFHQWVEKERLTFALVHLPLDLAKEPEPGRLFNAFLRNPVTWLGMSVPMVHNFINGLHKFYPSIPDIPFAWSGSWFTDRPWSELTLGALILYYSIFGLSFLLTTEMSFSVWSFYILFRLSFVFIAWLGAGSVGFWGDWGNQVGQFQSGGAVIVMALFLFWTARKPLGEWLGRVASGGRDAESDPLHPRVAFLLIVTGVAGMCWWQVAAGSTWWISILTTLIFLSVVLVLTRIVAEAGMLQVGTGVAALALVTGLFPAAWIGGAAITVLTMVNGVFMADLQCIAMPYLMNGLKATRETGLNSGKVLAVFAVTGVLAYAAAAYGRISTNYKYGGSNLDKLGTVWVPQWNLPGPVGFQKNPPEPKPVKVAGVKLLEPKAMHLLLGAALAVAMLFMRSRFLWWPLHPLGLVICTQIAMSWIWFSIFLGWLAKACVMSFGGAGLYRKVLPFFLGLILGECLIAVFWMGVSWWTGQPGYNLLMHW